MTKFILWDNDGVLVDTEYWYFKSTQQALAEIGIELTKARYMQIMVQGQSSWDLAREVNISQSKIDSKRKDRDAYYQNYIVQKDIEIAGVMAVLERLARHYKMAIVTTSKRKDFDLIHKNRGIVSMMDFVLAREDYELSKPHPEPYLLAMNKFGAEAKDCIVVEDSQRGLSAAIAADIRCVVVHNEFTASHDFSGAHRLVRTLDEIPDVIME